MLEMIDPESLSVEIINNPNEILKYLQIGISIPVREEFHDYILHDLHKYQAKSLIIRENDEVVGHVLLYDDGGEVLFFGFFGVIDHEEKNIESLLLELIKYAQKHKFKKVRGPINPPTFIYGYGFMTKDSLSELCISKPVNPSIYQEMFTKYDFYIKSKQGTLEGKIFKVPEEELKRYDLEEYEIYSPAEWDDLPKLKLPILILSARNLAPESRVTPNPENLFDNAFSFLRKYGAIYMVKLLRHKQSKQFVGCLIMLPNPFTKNQNGKYDSIVGYSITIDKDHRGKGLSIYLAKAIYDPAYEDGIRFISAPVEINVAVTRNLAKTHFGLPLTRTHLILERNLL